MAETTDRDDAIHMALNVRSISKAYGVRPVLKNVDIAVPQGQAVCLLGVNGAGKSTLLRIIAGLLRPDHGTVAVNDYDVRRQPEAAKRQLGLISHASMMY